MANSQIGRRSDSAAGVRVTTELIHTSVHDVDVLKELYCYTQQRQQTRQLASKVRASRLYVFCTRSSIKAPPATSHTCIL